MLRERSGKYDIARPRRVIPFPKSFARKYLNNMKLRHNCNYTELKTIYDSSFGLCILCEKQLDFKDGRPPDLHHDHKTGTIYGFTCHRCNLMIAGALEDTNVSYLQVRRYLKATRRSFLFDTSAAQVLTFTDRNTTPAFDFDYMSTDDYSHFKNLKKISIYKKERKEMLDAWASFCEGNAL